MSRWSLRQRIERWCVVVGTGFVSLLALLGCLLTYTETGRELDAIADEEFREMIEDFATSRGRVEDFRASSAAVQDSHPDDPMAWRVWRRADGSAWTSVGRPELLALFPSTPQGRPEVGRTRRFRAGVLNDQLELALLLEGGREVASERLFFLTAAASVILAAGTSFLAGRILGGRIAGALAEIARATRVSVGSRSAPPARDDLPDEIQDVASALREALLAIQRESDRSRLLAAGLAHELRSPLQYLRMQAEVVLLRPRDNHAYVEALTGQLHEIEELIRAVDNLVTLCAPPEARRRRQAESFDLSTEVRIRLRQELERGNRDGVGVDLELPENLPFRGDREMLVLALRNLVANAIDWSPRGGRVDLRARRTDAYWTFEVDDGGPGVPAQDQERIFRPFERGAPRPDGRVGYGLGLALVRSVAESHGGTIEVGTSPAGGARFRLRLPSDDAGPEASTS